MKDDKQAESWSRLYGVRDYPNLVAQIFFPTNGFDLDQGDRAALDSLISNYRIALLGRRIELKFVGHADYRGNVEYNKRLGLRRARSVEAHFTQNLQIMTSFFSSSIVSMGEKFASRTDLAADRRVDLFSSYIPKQTVVLPPVSVVVRVPKPQVDLPVQYVDITMTIPKGGGDHVEFGMSYHSVIIEQYGKFDVDYTVPHNNRQICWNRHRNVPLIDVTRNRIGWRRWQRGDTVRVGAKTTMEILCRVAGTSCDAGTKEDIPKFAPPNMVYGSWAEYERRNGTDEFVKKYKGQNF